MARVNMQVNPEEMKRGSILFEKGDYLFQCVEVVDTDKEGNVLLTKKGDRQRFDLELVVAKGPRAGKARVFHNGTLIPAGEDGHGMALSCFHAFGIWEPGQPLDVELQDMKSRYVLAKADVEPERTVGNNTYDAKMKIVRWYALSEEDLQRECIGAIDCTGGASASFQPAQIEEQQFEEAATPPAPAPRVAAAPARTAPAPAPRTAAPVSSGRMPWKKK